MNTIHYARPSAGIIVEVKDLPAEGEVLSPAAINQETGEEVPATIFSLEALFGPDHGWIAAPAEVGPGWTYEGQAFAPPAPLPEAIEVPPRLTFNQFMDLFTDPEQTAIAGAAMADVATKLWYDRAVGANVIDMADPRTLAGLQKLVDAKLLTAKRRDRVLQGLAPA